MLMPPVQRGALCLHSTIPRTAVWRLCSARADSHCACTLRTALRPSAEASYSIMLSDVPHSKYLRPMYPPYWLPLIRCQVKVEQRLDDYMVNARQLKVPLDGTGDGQGA